MKKPKFFEIEFYGKKYKVCFYVCTYTANGNIAIELHTDKGEPFADVTVNLGFLAPGYGYLDVNQLSDVEKIMQEHGFGHPEGTRRQSGYVSYPLYEFHLDKMKEYIHPASEYFMLNS